MALLEKKAFADLCGLKTKDLSNYQKRKKVEYTEGGLVDTSILKNQVFYALHRHKGNGATVDFDVPETPQQDQRARKDNAVRSSSAEARKETKTSPAVGHGADAQAVQDVLPSDKKKKAGPKAAVSEKRRTKHEKPSAARQDADGDSEQQVSIPVAKHATSRKKVGDDDEYEDPDIIMSTFEAENKYKSARAVKVTHEAELMKLKVAKVRGSVIPTELVMPVFIQHNQSILMAQKATDDEIISDIAHRFKIPAEAVAELRGKWATDRNAAMDRAIEASEMSVDAILINFIDEKI